MTPLFPPPPVKGTLYAHQLDAYARALETLEARGGYGLLFEMGLGKSMTAIAVMGTLYQQGKIARALIIAPKSVCPVWVAEFSRWSDYPHTCIALTGSSAARAVTLSTLRDGSLHAQTGLAVAVTNYESVWRADLAHAIDAFNPDIIICDESQRIKDSQSKQAKSVHKLGARARYRLILSGTPIGNSPLDVFSQYKFLDWSVFGRYFTPFRARYATMGGMRVNGKPVQIVGYKSLDELSEKCYSIASRATKADALDLPEKTFIRQPVIMSDQGIKAYAAMKRDSLLWLDQHEATATNVLTRLLRLQQITGGFITDELTGQSVRVDTGKLDALRDIIDDYVIDGGGKLVVFARFRAEIEAILEMLSGLPGKVFTACISGSVSQADREKAVNDFQNDPDCRVFVGQTQAAAEGITLHAAHMMVFYSVDFSYTRYAQAQDRIHRIGQNDRCTYVNLCCGSTIDTDVLDSLASKKDLAVSVLDDGWKRLFN